MDYTSWELQARICQVRHDWEAFLRVYYRVWHKDCAKGNEWFERMFKDAEERLWDWPGYSHARHEAIYRETRDEQRQ